MGKTKGEQIMRTKNPIRGAGMNEAYKIWQGMTLEELKSAKEHIMIFYHHDMRVAELMLGQINFVIEKTRYKESNMKTETWQEIIDNYLVPWLADPSQLEEDGIPAPAKAVIQSAIDHAYSAQGKGQAAPLRVVCDGEGGIIFENKGEQK